MTLEQLDTTIGDFADRLLYRMKLTEGARYQAARRHQRRAIASIWAIIFLSMYVFSTSTYIAVYGATIKPGTMHLLTMLNIIMSAFIIAFSVLEQGKKHDLKSDLFLRCAQGIQILRDDLEVAIRANKLDHETIVPFVKQYNDTVHDFTDNHSELDYRTFRINIGKHADKPWYRFKHAFLYWMDCWALMLAAIFVPPLAFSVLYSAFQVTAP